MMIKNSISIKKPHWAKLNYIYLVLLLLSLSFIISAAMFMQYAFHEIPCPLCLLQRVAYFGICFGVILNFRERYRIRHMGISMLFTIFLLIVSVRQSLLDIVKEPGHHWIGSSILGLHMPVWSVVFSLLLLISYAVIFSIVKQSDFLTEVSIKQFPWLSCCANVLSWYVIALCAINFISVILQCGIYECHTFYYRLLQ